MSRVLRSVKNVVKNYTQAEILAREATSNDAWFCGKQLLDDIARYTLHPVSMCEIHAVIVKRLNDNGKNWRHVAKSLILFEHIAIFGSEKVYDLLCESTVLISTLETFTHIDKDGKDRGFIIRERSKRLMRLIGDKKFFEAEKAKLKRSHANIESSTYFRKVESDVTAYRHSAYHPQTSGFAVDAPKTHQEEEDNLQLALAISKQEAETEEISANNENKNDSFNPFGERQNPMRFEGNTRIGMNRSHSPANQHGWGQKIFFPESTLREEIKQESTKPPVLISNDKDLLDEIFSNSPQQVTNPTQPFPGNDLFTRVQRESDNFLLNNPPIIMQNVGVVNDPFITAQNNQQNTLSDRFAVNQRNEPNFGNNQFTNVQQNFSNDPFTADQFSVSVSKKNVESLEISSQGPDKLVSSANTNKNDLLSLEGAFLQHNLDLLGNTNGGLHCKQSNPFEVKKDKGAPLNELRGSDLSDHNDNNEQNSSFSGNLSSPHKQDPFGF